MKETKETLQDSAKAANDTATAIQQTLKASQTTTKAGAKLASTVDAAALRRGLAADTAQLATRVHAMVLSITWPHFTFSLLPLMVVHVHLPAFLSNLKGWFQAMAVLNFGVIGRPECMVDEEASAADKKLLRILVSHGAFWAVLAALAFVGRFQRYFRCCSGHGPPSSQTPAAHAVNASVWVFLLGHAVLLRSSLGVLHCIGSGENGRLQNDPDVSCDLRSTWLMASVAVAIAAIALGIKKTLKAKNNLGSQQLGCTPVLIGAVSMVLCVGLSLLGFAAAAYLVDMIRQRASSGEILPRLGLAGMLVYGMMIPVNLYWKLAKAAGQNLLDSPDCRGRYGFLYDRFKPGKWGGRIPDPQPKDHAALRHNPFG